MIVSVVCHKYDLLMIANLSLSSVKISCISQIIWIIQQAIDNVSLRLLSQYFNKQVKSDQNVGICIKDPIFHQYSGSNIIIELQAYELHQFIIIKSTIHGRIPLFPRQITTTTHKSSKTYPLCFAPSSPQS